jgi:hypothetical protein
MTWQRVFENPASRLIADRAIERLSGRLGFEWIAVRDRNALSIARRHPDNVFVRVKPGTNEGRVVELFLLQEEWEDGRRRKNYYLILQGKTFERRKEALVQGARLAASLIGGR